MQIGVSSVSTLPVPAAYRRDGLAERQQNPNAQPAVSQQQPAQQTAQRGEVTRIRPRPSVAAQNLNQQAARYADNLTPHARNAVTAYSNNGPSIAERLGVELAGVDTYA